MRAASEEYGWDLKYGDIAMIFRGGCIIRAAFLQKIKEAYDRDPELENLLLDPYFKNIVESYQEPSEKFSLAVEQRNSCTLLLLSLIMTATALTPCRPT